MQWQRVQRASKKLSTPYKYLTCCFGFCCIRNWKSKYFHFRQGFHNRLWLWHSDSIFWMFRVIFLQAAQSTGLFSWLSAHRYWILNIKLLSYWGIIWTLLKHGETRRSARSPGLDQVILDRQLQVGLCEECGPVCPRSCHRQVGHIAIATTEYKSLLDI